MHLLHEMVAIFHFSRLKDRWFLEEWPTVYFMATWKSMTKSQTSPNTGGSYSKALQPFIWNNYDNNFGGLRLRSLFLSTTTAEAIIRHYIDGTGQFTHFGRCGVQPDHFQFPEGIPTVICTDNPINNRIPKIWSCSIAKYLLYAQ